MTVIDEDHRYLVRQKHVNALQPPAPVLDITFMRTQPARVINAASGQRLTTHFYDPLTPSGQQPQETSYPHTLDEMHIRTVRFRHDGVTPAAPDLGIMLDTASTRTVNAQTGLKITLYEYLPDFEPVPIGDMVAFGDSELFTFGDAQVFAFGVI